MHSTDSVAPKLHYPVNPGILFAIQFLCGCCFSSECWARLEVDYLPAKIASRMKKQRNRGS